VQLACEAAAHRDGADYGIVAEYGGHRYRHVDAHGSVPAQLRRAGPGPAVASGMALAVEPMLTAGDPETKELEDGWTVVTADGARAVHWEHSVAITEDGPRILTLPAD